MALVTSIVRVQQLVTSQVEACLRPHGLSFARYEVLRLLAFSRSGALPMGVVGRRLQVHPASVTGAVDRLERDGLVERRRSTEDGRRVEVALRSAGRDLVERATIDLNHVFTSLPFNDDDMSTVVGVFRDFRRAVGDIDDSGRCGADG